MLYFDIIPLAKLPLTSQPFFTYSFPEPIEKGSLVEINFANQKVKGIVFSTTRRPSFPVKTVTKIIAAGIITENQLLLAKMVSDQYYSPIGVTLKFCLPPEIKKIPAFEPMAEIKTPTKKISLTAEQQKATHLLVHNPEKPALLSGPASAGKTEVLMQLIRHHLAKNKQVLVLIPEIFLSYQEIQRYFHRFSSQTQKEAGHLVLLHSEIKPSQMAAAHQAIKSGQARIILATRNGLFAPFKNLGLVIVDEEQDISFKQWDQSPRYHTRIIAPILSKIYSSQLVYSSATPSLENFLSAKNSSLADVRLPRLSTGKIIVEPPKVTIVDLKKYYFKNRNRPIILSDELRNALSTNLKMKKTSLVLVSRQGKGKSVICLDCRKILLCPNCQLPMIGSGDNYRCLHCRHQINSFSKCPSCGSFRLKNLGFGTEKAADDLSLFFPSASIEVADAQRFKSRDYREKLYSRLASDQLDILVGSQSIVKGFDLPNINLVAVLNADSWAGQSDFRFDERWLGSLMQLCGRLNRPGSGNSGEAIIQTYRPENPLLQYLKEWDWKAFAEAELENRRGLAYPPFLRLIRLTFKDANLSKVEKITQAVYNELMEAAALATTQKGLGHEISRLSIIPPYWGTIKKIRGKWQKNILLKVEDIGTSCLRPMLSKLAKDWIIDIDPNGIFN